MIDLSALRRADYRNPSVRPWGRDYRAMGLDDVQLTVPGTPAVLATRLRLADLGPYTLLSMLGVGVGGVAGWTLFASMRVDLPSIALLLLPVVGAIVGWLLLGRVVAHALSVQAYARLGLAQRVPLVLTVRRVSDTSDEARALVELLDSVGDGFLAGEIDDSSFLTATAHAIEALDDPGNDFKVETARLGLEGALADPAP
ncbi:MAG: hypothetical protein L0G69_01465 [Brevibacterium sp.]|nr:hypothetical protein [Brevibacterium sp.]